MILHAEYEFSAISGIKFAIHIYIYMRVCVRA